MSKTLNQKEEPGMSPALPTQALIDRNIREWNKEVVTRVRVMVDGVVTNNLQPSPEALRALGADGAAYFRSRLRLSIKADLDAKTTASAIPQMATRPEALPREGMPSPQLIASLNWKDKQGERLFFVERIRRTDRLLVFTMIGVVSMLLNIFTKWSIPTLINRLLGIFS